MRLGRSVGVTDTGRKRRRNEDSYVCEPPLFAIADGMGGAQAGELASALAAEALREHGVEGDGEERVASLIQEANRRVYRRSSEDAAASGMGTTVTAALVLEDRVAFGHVGDSRAYLLRDGELEQVTDDHSLVAELVRGGKLSPEEAETHPQRSVITRNLGSDPDVDVDSFSVETREGDLFLVCSDGLTSMISDSLILEILERHRRDLDAAARALVQAANRSGGEDNITVLCFEIVGATAPGEETARYPAAAPEPEPGPDEEDTLSGLEAVPAVDTIVVPPAQVAGLLARTAPVAPPEADGPRYGRRALVGVGALALLAGICVLAVWGLARAHFIGARADGRVAVYQGVPYDLVAGLRLYRPVYVSRVVAGELTRPERQALLDHRLRRSGSALATVHAVERKVAP